MEAVLHSPTLVEAKDHRRLTDLLLGLYRKQLTNDSELYLIEHAEPHRVAHQSRVFGWYYPWIQDSLRVLDLGCAHGPDACMLRAVRGDDVAIDGCDFWAADRFGIFREAAGMDYVQLSHHASLPYDDASMDAVIASGVIEHAAQDYELLKETYRILRPGGRLVVTFLPNRWSSEEWKKRNLARAGFHRRLYGRAETATLLSRAGFIMAAPVQAQSFMWEKRIERITSNPNWIRVAADVMRKLVPIHLVSSTWCVVAEKVLSM